MSAYEPPARNVPEKPANDAVFKAMRLLLDDEEYENFVAAATRLSKTARLRMGMGGGGGGVVQRAPDR